MNACGDMMTQHGMTMRYPATRWQDALPVGSGVVGALLYGNIASDTIVLNHDALRPPRPRPRSVDVSDQVPAMRELVKAGRCREAANLMREVYAERQKKDGDSAGGSAYQPFCSVSVDTDTDGPFRDYQRGLDFETGRAWLDYADDAATFSRDLFVSRVTDTIFLRLRSYVPGTVSCRLSLGQTVNEQTHEHNISESSARLRDLQTSVEACLESRMLVFRGTYGGTLHFGAVGQVSIAGGTVTATEKSLVIADADEVVLAVRLFCNEDHEAAVSRLRAGFEDTPTDYESAFAEHAALHGELFGRVSLSLGNSAENACRQSNEEMLMAGYGGEVPDALVKTMFDFGRYLLISSSREGGWPINLQGIWNGDYAPDWNSGFVLDENVEMSYWSAYPCGLSETVLPLFDFFERHMDDFRENARNNFGCRGIQVPLGMSTDGIMPVYEYGYWVSAAGWIAQHFYDYYLFTGDTGFLRDRVLPFLKEIAVFYEDYLVEDKNGTFCFNPSFSPENRPTNSNSLVAINATIDVAICREVLTNLCDACEMLGVEADGVSRWRSILQRLPAYTANADGALREWLHPGFEDNYHHRHQSHLYPIFPGMEITEESNPEIFEAGRIAVEKRMIVGLTNQSGWSMAHMANSYARLHEGDRALECLELLTRGTTGPNLFTYHNDWRKMGLAGSGTTNPPFQIDANLGFTAAVLEMLVFSKPGMLRLLPALPQKWQSGSITGINCRGGITVDISWNRAEGTFSAKLVSRQETEVRIYVPDWVRSLQAQPDPGACVANADGFWNCSLEKNTPLCVTMG